MRITFFILRRKFQRRAATILGAAGVALLAVGTPAWAATYYVAPGGNDSSAGTSVGTAWRTLAKVNSSLQPGDVVLIQPGSYSDGIAPARDGGASSRISYVGSLTSPGAAVVASIDLTGRKYISVKGVASTGSTIINASGSGVAAMYDSLLYAAPQAYFDMSGAWYCYVGKCTIGNDTDGDKFHIDIAGGAITAFCTVEGNTFNLSGTTGGAVMSLASMRNCTFSRNVYNGRSPAANSDCHLLMQYRLKNCTFTDSRFNYTSLSVNNDTYGFYLRDSTRFCSWVRDTFVEASSSTRPVRYVFAAAGAYNDWRASGDGLGSCAYNTWTKCYFKSSGDAGSSGARVHGYNFFGNQFIGKQHWTLPADSLTMRHNTFMITEDWRVIDDQQSDMTNATLRSNIFYATGSTTYGTVLIPDVASVRSDSNLVYSAGGNSNNAFWVRSTGSACKVRPGCSWCDTYGKDCNSQWGDPQFGSVTWANPDPTPRTGSIALSSGLWPDGYVGAIASGTSAGDLTAPAAVGDLALALISDHTIVLRWTATGDDGTTGQASVYDLRWSNQPITASNFAAATPVGIQPVPAVAGTPQSYVLTDLILSTNYYFALRVADESGNWSDMGNVLAATTKATDTVPPAPITFGP